jgi:glycine/D-amino acid oxidase-like deaminating enzyme
MSAGLITEKRDLRTGVSVWRDTPRIRVRCRTPAPTEAEIVIVGAGVSGAALAYRLRRKGRNVLVLDRREPLHGSTAASTALLLFEIDTPLFELARRMGRDKAARAWRRSLRAVGDLRRIVARERIRCGWRDTDTLYLAGDSYGARALKAEATARRHASVPGDYLNAADLEGRFGVERTGGILSAGSAQANPMQLAAGLLRRAMREGVRICSPVAVKAVAADSSGVILTTDDDREIAAEKVVFCTGYEVMKAVPDKGHAIQSTWAFASAPQASAPAWLKNCSVWEASDPYLYMRLTRDGRIVAGGEDEPFSKAHADKDLLVEKTDRIAEKVRALLPDAKFRIAYRWAGAFGVTGTGLPFIDAVSGHPNCYAVMGFGGNGITYAIIAAEIVAALIAGRDDPDTDLYRFE